MVYIQLVNHLWLCILSSSIYIVNFLKKLMSMLISVQTTLLNKSSLTTQTPGILSPQISQKFIFQSAGAQQEVTKNADRQTLCGTMVLSKSFNNKRFIERLWLQVPIPSVADPLIDCATTSFAINQKSCTGPRADKLPMHDRGSGTEGRYRGLQVNRCFCLLQQK